MTRRTALFASVTSIVLASLASAQTIPIPAAQQSGITAYLQFGGTANSDGQVYALSPSVGYDFNTHFGMAVGAPVYFIRPSSSTGSTSATGLGDPFLGLHLRYPNEILNFATFLTGMAPVGNSKQGLSTGGATFDWTSHIDHSISRLTPFLEGGFANTTVRACFFVPTPHWDSIRISAVGPVMPRGNSSASARRVTTFCPAEHSRHRSPEFHAFPRIPGNASRSSTTADWAAISESRQLPAAPFF